MQSLTSKEIAEIIANSLDVDIGDDGYGAAVFAEILVDKLVKVLEDKPLGYWANVATDADGYGVPELKLEAPFNKEEFKIAAIGKLLGECVCLKYWGMSQCSNCLALREHTTACIPCSGTFMESINISPPIKITFGEETANE